MNTDHPRPNPISKGIITTDVEALTAFYRQHAPRAVDMQPILRVDRGAARIVGVLAIYRLPRPPLDGLTITRTD